MIDVNDRSCIYTFLHFSGIHSKLIVSEGHPTTFAFSPSASIFCNAIIPSNKIRGYVPRTYHLNVGRIAK